MEGDWTYNETNTLPAVKFHATGGGVISSKPAENHNFAPHCSYVWSNYLKLPSMKKRGVERREPII